MDAGSPLAKLHPASLDYLVPQFPKQTGLELLDISFCRPFNQLFDRPYVVRCGIAFYERLLPEKVNSVHFGRKTRCLVLISGRWVFWSQ
jgi:hypothetical protein